MKKTTLFLALISIGLLSSFQTFATPNNLHIIPEYFSWGSAEAAEQEAREAVNFVGNSSSGGTVIERYNEQAEKIAKEKNLWKAFKTWIMNWDTIPNYIVYLMKFLNQLGLLIGGMMILYAGYLYAGTIFGFGDPSSAKNAIKNAIIGVIILVASYAIWAGIQALFL